MKQLTTHIEGDSYENVVSRLEDANINFTQPKRINTLMENHSFEGAPKNKSHTSIAHTLFVLNNLPMVLLWRLGLKPKVPEPEFMATFRFGFSLFVYPMVYALVLLIFSYGYDLKTACLLVIGHAVLNLLLVKRFGVTSSVQRK